MAFVPPKIVQHNAQIAIGCLKQGSKAMTSVGKKRANELANRKPQSLEDLKEISKFNRHRKNKSYSGDPCKDRGFVAWNGWGGDEGIAWAKRKLKRFSK